MKKIVAESFKRPITKEQSKDTGMAMVLLLLIASAAFKRQALITAAMIAMVTRVSRLKAALASKSKDTGMAMVLLLCSFVMGRLNDSATIFFM